MAVDDKPVVSKIGDASDKVTNVVSQWWNLTTAEKKKPVDPKNLITVKDLPIYAEDSTPITYQFVEDEPLPLQREFATFRKAFQTEYDRVASRFAIIDKAVTSTKGAVNKANQYVQEEWTVLPKAAAITVGGMAGFVLGLKRGTFGRILTTGGGFVTMAAFCYPRETVDVVRTGIAHTEQSWHSFQQSPSPPEKKKVDLSPPK